MQIPTKHENPVQQGSAAQDWPTILQDICGGDGGGTTGADAGGDGGTTGADGGDAHV